MSRASGRKQREPKVEDISPDSPRGHQLGLSARMQGYPSPIPGARPHLSNAPAVRHTVPVPASTPEIGMGNEHGVVPGSHTNQERAEARRGPNSVHVTMPQPRHQPVHERPAPIPVVVVQDHHQAVFRTAAPHTFSVPATSSDPVRLCGRDMTRTEVMILNESASQTIRIAQRLSDLTAGGGALMPAASSSYLTIKTQDELWALSTSGSTAAQVSVIQIFERGD